MSASLGSSRLDCFFCFSGDPIGDRLGDEALVLVSYGTIALSSTVLNTVADTAFVNLPPENGTTAVGGSVGRASEVTATAATMDDWVLGSGVACGVAFFLGLPLFLGASMDGVD